MSDESQWIEIEVSEEELLAWWHQNTTPHSAVATSGAVYWAWARLDDDGMILEVDCWRNPEASPHVDCCGAANWYQLLSYFAGVGQLPPENNWALDTEMRPGWHRLIIYGVEFPEFDD